MREINSESEIHNPRKKLDLCQNELRVKSNKTRVALNYSHNFKIAHFPMVDTYLRTKIRESG